MFWFSHSVERIGDLEAVIRRDRHRHYTVRVYRGAALTAIFASLSAYRSWKKAQA